MKRWCLWCVLVVAALSACAAVSQAACQEGENPPQRLTEDQQYLFELIKQQLDSEVMILQITSEITEQQVAAVKQAVQQVADAAKQRIRNEEDGYSEEALQRQQQKTSTDLATTLQKLVENQTLTQSQWQQYEQDQQIKRKLLLDALKATSAARIELRFVPHGDQSNQLQRLMDQWIDQHAAKQDLSTLVETIAYGDVLRHLPRAELQQCLTPEQWAYHSAYQDRDGGGMEMMFALWTEFESDSEATVAKVRKLFLQHLGLIQHRIKLELQLTAGQARKLEIAGKGAVDRLIKQQTKAYQRIVQDEEGVLFDEEIMQVFYSDCHTLLSESKLLNRTLEKTLDEKQREQLTKLRKMRAELMLDANLNYLVASLDIYSDEGIVLTGEQFRQCCELFKKRIKPENLAGGFPDEMLLYRQMGALKKEDLLTIFNEQQATALASLFSEFNEELGELEDDQIDQR